MAGSELDGLDGADPNMFAGAVWVLTPTAAHAGRRPSPWWPAWSASWGPRWWPCPPEAHDALVAVVSHVPHLTAATLMTLAERAAPRTTPPCCAWPPAASGT